MFSLLLLQNSSYSFQWACSHSWRNSFRWTNQICLMALIECAGSTRVNYSVSLGLESRGNLVAFKSSNIMSTKLIWERIGYAARISDADFKNLLNLIDISGRQFTNESRTWKTRTAIWSCWSKRTAIVRATSTKRIGASARMFKSGVKIARRQADFFMLYFCL